MNNQINQTTGTVQTFDFKVTFDLASNRRLYGLSKDKVLEFIQSFDLMLSVPDRELLNQRFGFYGDKQLQVMNIEVSEARDLSHHCCTHDGIMEATKEANCPECEGNNLNEDKTRCWDCQPER